MYRVMNKSNVQTAEEGVQAVLNGSEKIIHPSIWENHGENISHIVTQYILYIILADEPIYIGFVASERQIIRTTRPKS